MFMLESCLAAVKMPRSSLLFIAYSAWCIGVSAFSLSFFVQIVERYLAVSYDYKSEAVFVTAQVGFQWLFMMRSNWEERVRYMFIALTVSMMGSLMLLPLLLCHSYRSVSALTATVYFFVVVSIIFAIHYRLIVRNSLPRILSRTWVLYRVLLLCLVLIPR